MTPAARLLLRQPGAGLPHKERQCFRVERHCSKEHDSQCPLLRCAAGTSASAPLVIDRQVDLNDLIRRRPPASTRGSCATASRAPLHLSHAAFLLRSRSFGWPTRPLSLPGTRFAGSALLPHLSRPTLRGPRCRVCRRPHYSCSCSCCFRGLRLCGHLRVGLPVRRQSIASSSGHAGVGRRVRRRPSCLAHLALVCRAEILVCAAAAGPCHCPSC